MKRFFVLLFFFAPVATGKAEVNLSKMLIEASRCSDASLQEGAVKTCDAPALLAAKAVAKCQSQWNAIADQALAPASTNESAAEHKKALTKYVENIQLEYSRLAELRAIDMRRDARACDFE